jgi:hypothetical protein
MGTSTRMFERTYDRHALDTSVRRGVASYQQLVGSPTSPPGAPPPQQPAAASPPAALPLFRLPAPPRGPGGTPLCSPRAWAREGAGGGQALTLSGGGARERSPSDDGGSAGDDAGALDGCDDGDLLVSRLQAAYGKRPRAASLTAGAQPPPRAAAAVAHSAPRLPPGPAAAPAALWARF